MTKKKVLNYALRYALFIAGLFIMAIGIALSTRAGLGTSPISCLPYALSMVTPQTLGVLSTEMNLVFVVLQIILLRRDFEPIQLLQFPVAFLFGWFIDVAMQMTAAIAPQNYVLRCLLCLAATVILAFGIFTEVKARVVMNAGEGLVNALATITKREFGIMKVIFDVTLVCIGATITLVMLGNLAATREGTVTMAVLTGFIVRFYWKHIYWYDNLTEPIEMEEDLEQQANGDTQASRSQSDKESDNRTA